jgi:hypothetical protein
LTGCAGDPAKLYAEAFKSRTAVPLSAIGHISCVRLAVSVRLYAADAGVADSQPRTPAAGVIRCEAVAGERNSITPQSFFSLNSPSITVSSVLLGRVRPANAKTTPHG